MNTESERRSKFGYRVLGLGLAGLILPAFLLVGCVSPSSNQANGDDTGTTVGSITANAGSDQVVEDQTTVTLIGQGSDSTGAAVTFHWAQQSGTPVTLANADTATASFLSPSRSSELVFVLTVHSTNGDATDEMKVTVNAAPLLFVANQGNNSITSFRAGVQLNGGAAPVSILQGAATKLDMPSDVAFDGIGGLLVCNSNMNHLLGFTDVLANGNVAPNRDVNGAVTLLKSPQALAYDATRDKLYVANFDGPDDIVVFSGVNTPTFSGGIAGTSIQSNIIANARDLHLTAADDLYVLDAGFHMVGVFANASTKIGNQTPTRLISSTLLTSNLPQGIFIDGEDRLYIVDSTGKRVLMFAGASGLDGPQNNPTILDVASLPGEDLRDVVVDGRGTGYITDAANSTIYIYENIASRSGSVTPDRTVSGVGTGLSFPNHVQLLPR